MTQHDDMVTKILDTNHAILQEFFIGQASGRYYDGTCWQLYWDQQDDTLFIYQEVSCNSWLQRDDHSLRLIVSYSGYCDIPEEELFHEGDCVDDFGYAEWLEFIASAIEDAIDREHNC
ncbi:MAG: hypothetical protein C7B43_16665 [Sulfobacillus benefaciens]|uniref:Uncharacterized protein n=1 Tax=Sulfobacillus benefaciens TaxID=453960 RepID=A0A2T2WTG7_9FIRM|nr:MAG: hypothetical protein C7B43_16665 [Sulfobacillus benefaciens]